MVTGWLIDSAITARFSKQLSGMLLPQTEAFLRDAYAIANGGIVSLRDEAKEAAAALISERQNTYRLILWVAALGLAVAGFAWGTRKIAPAFRARKFVEMRGIVHGHHPRGKQILHGKVQ